MNDPLTLPRQRAATASRLDWTPILLVGILMLAVGLRLYRLGDVPFGFHPDEGHNATDALAILDGWRPAFLPRDNGREPLFSYLMAASIAVFGPTVWAARLVGAISGALAVLAQYLFVAALPLPRPKLTALVSAALLAVTFWPVAISHQALRSGLFPLWVTLLLWAWWKSLVAPTAQAGGDFRAPRAWLWPSLAGAFLAGAIYTHMMGRLMLPVLAASALWVLLRERRWGGMAALAVALGVASVLLLPMLLYFLTEPEMVVYRATQISVFSPEVNKGDLWGTLWEQATEIALAFNVRGSTAWVDNLAGRPIFDPLVGIPFLVGFAFLAWDLWGRRGITPQSAAVLLALTLPTMLAPSWLSAGAPSFGRMTGAWAVVFLLPAWSLERGAGWLSHHTRPWLGPAATLAIVAVSGVLSFGAFFETYANAPDTGLAFRSASVDRAAFINSLAEDAPVYVTPTIWSQAVMRYLASPAQPRAFDLKAGLVLPPVGDVWYAFEHTESSDADAFGRRWPMMERREFTNRFNQRSLIAFRLAADRRPALTPAAPSPVFGDVVRLEAYDMTPPRVAPGQPLSVTLQWEALALTDTDKNLFVHVVAPDGRTVGQYDGAPLRGSYGTHQWQPGERVLQPIEIPIARDAAPGLASVRIGWYDWRDGARLAVPGDDDAAVEIGRIEIGA